ncbi:MAG: Coenzyme F420 hydrogenase/dehydrogenase, beta subunit C-terminal domain [Thermoplasmata archaeon]|nr:Coenzyme F420 hydrogenase/dehydrogenase, beta subunit C-terminal domain [Thermoplasmata archaeon]
MVNDDEIMGEYRYIKIVKSLRTRGGAVTSLLSAILKERVIDGAVVVKADEMWRPEAVVATTEEEVLAAAGSKWVITPMVGAILDALSTRRLERIAVIGTPCQAQALRDLKEYPMQMGEFPRRIKLIIGLFCMGSFTQDGFKTMIETKYGIRLPEIKDAHVGEEYFTVYLKGGEEVKIPLEEFREGVQVACLSCDDFTARASDISAGRLGAPEGKTVFIIRTEEGEMAFKEAERLGYIKSEEASESTVKKIIEEGIAKWRRAERFSRKIP